MLLIKNFVFPRIKELHITQIKQFNYNYKSPYDSQQVTYYQQNMRHYHIIW